MDAHVDRVQLDSAGDRSPGQPLPANPAMGATVVRGITGHLPPAALALDPPPSGKGSSSTSSPKA